MACSQSGLHFLRATSNDGFLSKNDDAWLNLSEIDKTREISMGRTRNIPTESPRCQRSGDYDNNATTLMCCRRTPNLRFTHCLRPSGITIFCAVRVVPVVGHVQ